MYRELWHTQDVTATGSAMSDQQIDEVIRETDRRCAAAPLTSRSEHVIAVLAPFEGETPPDDVYRNVFIQLYGEPPRNPFALARPE